MERRSFLLTAAAGSAATVSALTSTAEASSDSPGLALPVPPQSAALGTTGANWPKVGGNYGNQNHSTLRGITPKNVRKLGGAWHVNLEGGSTSAYQQCTIVVQDGVLYVETTQQNVFAVNGRTGEVIWKTNLGTETTNMRGVAVAEGKVFTISGANIVHAVDQKTGAIVWQKPLIVEDNGGDDGCSNDSGQCGGNSGGLAGAVVHFDGLIYVGTEGSTAACTRPGLRARRADR